MFVNTCMCKHVGVKQLETQAYFFQNVSLGILGAKSPADYYSALIKPAPSGSTTVVFVRETNSFGGKIKFSTLV